MSAGRVSLRRCESGVLLLLLMGLAGCSAGTGILNEDVGNEGPSPLPWVTPAVQAVNVEHFLFPSDAAGAQVSAHIYLPDAYAALPEKRFPVLVWLHGSGGETTGIPPLANLFHQAIASGRIAPLIVLFPNGLPNGMWVNSADGRQPVETMVMQELIPFVDANYRSMGTAEGRLLEGFSMGGYGAARLGFLYPERFAGISMLGAGPLQLDFLAEGPRANQRQREQVLTQVYGGSLDYFKAVSPWRLAESAASLVPPGPGIPIRIVIGEDDELLELNRRFRDHLRMLEIPHEYVEVPGVAHAPLRLLQVMGDAFWDFHRSFEP